MRWKGREQSSNVEDRRGQSQISGNKTGIVGVLILLVGAYYGVDLSGIVGTDLQTAITETVSGNSSTHLPSQEEENLNELARVVLRDTEITWQGYFAQQGQQYQPPTMVLYSGVTPTACGTGQAAVGPFYCSADKKVYLDLSFYRDMKNKLGAAGDAAFAYVIAHEVGHHVQNQFGILPKVHQLQQQNRAQANQLSVKLELQADCFAGIWGYQAVKQGFLDEQDLELAFNAAEAVGDDRLQKRSQGYVVPDSFTHGTSAQRKNWFQKGLKTGNPTQCDTFKN